MIAEFYTSSSTKKYIPIFEYVLPTSEYTGVGSATGFQIYQFKETSSINPSDSDSLDAHMTVNESLYSSAVRTYGIKRLADEAYFDNAPSIGALPNTSSYNVVSYGGAGSGYSGGHIFLAYCKVGSNWYPGLLMKAYVDQPFMTGYGYTFAYTTNANDPLNKMWSELVTSPDPGKAGFKPISDVPKHVFGGGDISGQHPNYTTDTLALPGAPDESHGSAVSSGMVNVYQITEANLQALGKALFGTEGIDGLITKLQNSFLNPLDAIISLQVFPCTPDVGSSEHIKLFDWSSYVDKLGATASGNKLSKQFKTYNFGTLNISEQWKSYLDYDSTSFELYLPFIGSVDIPIAEVMNGSITVEYTVDFLTGMCVANVLCVKNVPLSSERSVPQYTEHSYMGNCSVQIPLNNVSYGNIIGSLMQAASAGLKTGNAGVALASLVESGLSGGLQPTVKTKGTINANAGFCSVLYPYISITRPITAESDSFQEVMGYPSYVFDKLVSYTGLCICDDIDLSNMPGATDSEMDEIRSICKSGIYI